MTADGNGARLDANLYSPQYQGIIRAGNTRTQDLGAPSLVWRVGVWLKENPQEIRGHLTPYEISVQARNSGYKLFLSHMNAVLARLQQRGRPNPEPPDLLQNFEGAGESVFTPPKPLGFTLWWLDRDQHHLMKPGYDALRVRFDLEAYRDHFVITFLIDVSKPWNAGPVYFAKDAPGLRRKKILTHVENIRHICQTDLPSGRDMDRPLAPLYAVPPPVATIPQDGLDDQINEMGNMIAARSQPASETESLLEASKYLYAGVWSELCKDFGIDLNEIAGPAGHIFANIRGLVFSVPGFESASSFEPTHSTAGRFLGFDAPGREPDAIINAYWPFIQRVTPFADYREHVACGLGHWKAIFVSPLGSEITYNSGDESIGRLYEVPSGNLPELPDSHGRTWMRQLGGQPVQDDLTLGPSGEEPIRYLLLTKGEPHRVQMGVIVSRVNELETCRVLAGKNQKQIEEAEEHILLRGQQIDDVMAEWASQRAMAEHKHGSNSNAKEEAFSNISSTVERALAEIRAGLGGLERTAPGGLSYSIGRSRYYANRFNQLRQVLFFQPIEPWVSYDQYANAGPVQNFEFIESLGHRLRAIQLRLSSMLVSIEASVFPLQLELGRRQTIQSQKLLRHFAGNAVILALVLGLFTSIGPLKTISEFVVDYCGSSGDLPFCRLHARLLGATAGDVFIKYLGIAAASVVVVCMSILIRMRRL